MLLSAPSAFSAHSRKDLSSTTLTILLRVLEGTFESIISLYYTPAMQGALRKEGEFERGVARRNCVWHKLYNHFLLLKIVLEKEGINVYSDPSLWHLYPSAHKSAQ